MKAKQLIRRTGTQPVRGVTSGWATLQSTLHTPKPHVASLLSSIMDQSYGDFLLLMDIGVLSLLFLPVLLLHLILSVPPSTDGGPFPIILSSSLTSNFISHHHCPLPQVPPRGASSQQSSIPSAAPVTWCLLTGLVAALAKHPWIHP